MGGIGAKVVRKNIRNLQNQTHHDRCGLCGEDRPALATTASAHSALMFVSSRRRCGPNPDCCPTRIQGERYSA
jgi:hypothetical protein